MSKQLVNEQMKGFRNVPLQFLDEDDQNTPLTVRRLFLLACNTYEGDNMKDWKIIADIMDTLDIEEKKEEETVTLDNAWYELIRPHVDNILPKAYKIHSPFMSEQLDNLLKPSVVTG
jgi:hypothetical protein